MRLLHLSWQDVAQSNKGRQSDIYFIFFSSSDCVSGFLLMFAKYDDDDGVWLNGLGMRKKGFLAINSASSGNSIKTNIHKLYLFLSNRHVSNTHFKKCDDNSNFHLHYLIRRKSHRSNHEIFMHEMNTLHFIFFFFEFTHDESFAFPDGQMRNMLMHVQISKPIISNSSKNWQSIKSRKWFISCGVHYETYVKHI